jgi:hypothetical protein
MVHSGWIRKDKNRDQDSTLGFIFNAAYYNPTLGRLRREGAAGATFSLLTGRKAAGSLVQAVLLLERMERISI